MKLKNYKQTDEDEIRKETKLNESELVCMILETDLWSPLLRANTALPALECVTMEEEYTEREKTGGRKE